MEHDVVTPSDEKPLPDISKLSKRQRMDLARELLDTTQLSVKEVAEKTALKATSVEMIRRHLKGILSTPSKPKVASEDDEQEGERGEQEDERPESEGEEEEEEEGEDGARTLPHRGDRGQVHIESALKDLDSRMDGIPQLISVEVNRLGEKILQALPSKMKVSSEARQPTFDTPVASVDTQFEAFNCIVPVDVYRRTLFGQWLATRNYQRMETGLPPLEITLPEFLLQTMDYWFDKREIDMDYHERSPVRAPTPSQLNQRYGEPNGNGRGR